MSATIAVACEIMRDALKEDEGLKTSYVSNIAALLYDKYKIQGTAVCTDMAEDILRLIFN